MTQITTELENSNSWKDKVKNYFSKLIRFKVESWKIALSLALGVFIGLLIPVGLQTVVVVPVAVLLKCNIFIATSATLISNPVTFVPLYYLYFKVGEFLTSIEISEAQLNALISSPTFDGIRNIGEDTIILFFSGSFPVSVLLGAVTYWLSLVLVKYYRRKKGIQIS